MAQGSKSHNVPTQANRQKRPTPRFVPYAGSYYEKRGLYANDAAIKLSADRCEAMRANERMDCARRSGCIDMAARRNLPCLPCVGCKGYVAINSTSST